MKQLFDMLWNMSAGHLLLCLFLIVIGFYIVRLIISGIFWGISRLVFRHRIKRTKL